MLRKWYFCVNELGFRQSLSNIRAAVMSARMNTNLEPHCIYFGTNSEHISMLERLGAHVIKHRPSFQDALKIGYGDQAEKFMGHWLRVDLPTIDLSDETVLYTDTDVLFLANPIVESTPALIAACTEMKRRRTGHFNSGVMLMNLSGLRKIQLEFIRSIEKRLLGKFRYPTHDQRSFNSFFSRSLINRFRGRSFEWMTEENNWKPYWGINKHAKIVHFHGPKPTNIRRFKSIGTSDASPEALQLWNMNRTAYDYYFDLWEQFTLKGETLQKSRLAQAK